MFKKSILALFIAAIAGSSIVFAATPIVNSRERRQMRRINRGERSGKLTKKEASELRGEVRNVKKEKREMLKENEGKPLTSEQRQELRQDLKETSKDIYQEKHD